jgi:hypothetical protein
LRYPRITDARFAVQKPAPRIGLSLPVSGCHEIIMKLLIDHGADVNARDDTDETPLHRAARSGQITRASLLLDHGADVNARDKGKWTPLDIAMLFREQAMADFLRARGGITGRPPIPQANHAEAGSGKD